MFGWYSMEFYHVTVDLMTTSYALSIKLSDKFNTKLFFFKISNFFKVIPTSNCKLSFRGLKQDSQNRLILKLFTQTWIHRWTFIVTEPGNHRDQYTRVMRQHQCFISSWMSMAWMVRTQKMDTNETESGLLTTNLHKWSPHTTMNREIKTPDLFSQRGNRIVFNYILNINIMVKTCMVKCCHTLRNRFTSDKIC
jgi:hypothetical protein